MVGLILTKLKQYFCLHSWEIYHIVGKPRRKYGHCITWLICKKCNLKYKMTNGKYITKN